MAERRGPAAAGAAGHQAPSVQKKGKDRLLDFFFGEEPKHGRRRSHTPRSLGRCTEGAKSLREGLREFARVALHSGAAGRRAAVAADGPGERHQAPGLVRAAGRDGRAAARREARRGDGHAESNRRGRVRAEAAPRVGRRAAGREDFAVVAGLHYLADIVGEFATLSARFQEHTLDVKDILDHLDVMRRRIKAAATTRAPWRL